MNHITPFISYLKNLGLNKTTLKNYSSDLSNFLGFSRSDLPTPEIVSSYKNHLQNTSPIPTTNRRLSAIRKYISYCYSTKLILYDFSRQITNVSLRPSVTLSHTAEILKKYRGYLLSLDISSNSIKNYLSDTKIYLTGNNTINKSPATLKRYQSSITKFQKWQNPTPEIVIPKIIVPEILPHHHKHRNLLVWILSILMLILILVITSVVVVKNSRSIEIIDPSPSHPTAP